MAKQENGEADRDEYAEDEEVAGFGVLSCGVKNCTDASVKPDVGAKNNHRGKSSCGASDLRREIDFGKNCPLNSVNHG